MVMERVQLVILGGQGKRHRYEYVRALKIKNERRSTPFLMENGYFLTFTSLLRFLSYKLFRKQKSSPVLRVFNNLNIDAERDSKSRAF